MLNKTFGASHEVEFFGNDASFLIQCIGFIGAALADGDAVIAIMNPSHRNKLRQKLESEGCDAAEAMEQGRYLGLEPSDVLSTVLVKDEPHAGRFKKASGNLIVTALKSATGKNPRVAVCGESAAQLRTKRNAEAAVEMEQLWNELASMAHVDSLRG